MSEDIDNETGCSCTAMRRDADVSSAQQRVMFSLLFAVSSSLIMDDHVVLAAIVGMCSSVLLFSHVSALVLLHTLCWLPTCWVRRITFWSDLQ